MEAFNPGRYAAIDVGSHSVLLLVADLDEEGRLTQVASAEELTRLSERFYSDRRLARPARDRTSAAIAAFAAVARRHEVAGLAAVGTSVLREAADAPEFLEQVRQECGVRIEVISGAREAELAYVGNRLDRALPPCDGERVVIDLGGGSTELVRGVGGEIRRRASYPIGAVRLTELYQRHDPPTAAEIHTTELAIEHALAEVLPAAVGSLVLASGGTVWTLAAVARSAGMIGPAELHGASLPHRAVAELIDLFRSLPLVFRRRVPGLTPERADIILTGAMILHQVMACLSVPAVLASGNGVRHGCIYTLARRTLSRRAS